MPAIKKKWIKASQDGGDVPDNDNDDILGDEEKDLGNKGDRSGGTPVVKAKKRPAQSSPQNSLLRGLDGEVLSEKRKRFIPPAEIKLIEWLDNNLEKRTEETMHLPHLYNYYTALCQSDGSDILDVPEFNRMIKEKFGKAFGLKESSEYKNFIKERKINKEKKKTSSGIKLKEIVHEAINHFENPWSGVRFFALKQYIGTKYPSIQIDLRPKLLKRALEMGVQYGQIDLVKGIGMAGYYKLPGGEPPTKVKPKTKKEDEGEKNADEISDAKDSEDLKERAREDSAQNGEKKEEAEEGKKKRKHKQKKAGKISFSKLHHGNPDKIEDIFPLAITYQSAPKAVGVPKIRRYIQEQYLETVPDNRWRKAIENGVEKGYWEHVSGSGMTGSLHLLMDDFDPNSEQIEDRICAAIIACHEPKAASANQIKKYISQYHPEFKVDERPDKFKKALLRAVSKNMIVQLSGLGASGSFQLASVFKPTPAVLAGGDDSSEEEGYDSDEPAYIPRGTKSRGIPKLKTMEVTSPKSGKSKGQKKPGSSSKGRNRRAVNSYAESSDEEDVKPRNKKSLSKKKNKAKASPKKRAHSPQSSDDEDEDAEQEPEYTPRKSQSRGGPSPRETPVKKDKKKAAKATKAKPEKSTEKADTFKEKTPVSKEKGPKSSKFVVSTDESESFSSKIKISKKNIKREPLDEEPSPAAKKAKKSKSKKNSKKSFGKSSSSLADPESPQPPKETASSKKNSAADSDDADSLAEPEYTPRKSKSRGGSEDMGKSESTKGKGSRSRK